MDRTKSFRTKNGISLNDVSWLGYTGNDIEASFSDEGDMVVRTYTVGADSYSELFLKKANKYVKLIDAKHNLNASVAPTVSNDSSQGYSVASMWIDTTGNKAYICVDNAVGGAIWIEMGGSGGGGGTAYPYAIVGEPSGFTNPKLIDVAYNPTNKTVTLTGNFVCLKQGVQIPELVSGYTSPAHPDPTGIPYFLFYEVATSTIKWSTTRWKDEDISIALVFRDDFNFCLREVHSFMDQRVRASLHKNFGTYVDEGLQWVPNSYVLNSNVATDRRPQIGEGWVMDEDLPTFIAASLGSGTYTHLRLTGSGTATEYLDQVEQLAVSGNHPYYNQFTGGVWTQTLMSNNSFSKGFVMAVPVTSDPECQKKRLVWIQPQNNSSDEVAIRALTPNSLNLGTISSALQEFVFVGEYIVQYTGGNWVLREVNNLRGTRYSQTSNPATVSNNKEVTRQYLKNFASATQMPNWSDASPQMPDYANYPTWINAGFQGSMTNARGAIMMPFTANRVAYSGRLRLYRIGAGPIASGTSVSGTIHLVRTNATNASVIATIPVTMTTTETLNQNQGQQPNNPSNFSGNVVLGASLPVGDYIGVSFTLASTDWAVIGDVSISLNIRAE
jgi:hypothetical protein